MFGIPLYAILPDPDLFVSAGAWDAGTNSCAPPYPTNISAGNTLVLVLHSDENHTPTTPSGWTSKGGNGGGPAGAGSVGFYTKTATGSESGTLAVTNTSGLYTGGAILNYKNVASVDLFHGGTGADVIADAGINVWHDGAVPDWRQGDVLLTVDIFNTPAFSYSNLSFNAEEPTSFKAPRQRVFATDELGYACLVAEWVTENASHIGAGMFFRATSTGSTASSPYAIGVTLRLVPS